jgi:hypothetical protein
MGPGIASGIYCWCMEDINHCRRIPAHYAIDTFRQVKALAWISKQTFHTGKA